jgi:hypothetical protein
MDIVIFALLGRLWYCVSYVTEWCRRKDAKVPKLRNPKFGRRFSRENADIGQ